MVDRSKLAFSYLRLSKVDLDPEYYVEAVSITAQRATIERYCLANGLRLLGESIDEGVSGAIPLGDRPRGAALVEQLTHPDARGVNVVAARLDRLFRSAADALVTLDRWEKIPVRLHLCDMPTPDIGAPAGRLVLQLLAVCADFERRMIAERTRAALAQMRAANRRTSGNIRWGWELDEDPKKIRPALAERAVMGRMWEWAAQGAKAAMIAKVLRAAGEITTRTCDGQWGEAQARGVLKALAADRALLESCVSAEAERKQEAARAAR